MRKSTNEELAPDMNIADPNKSEPPRNSESLAYLVYTGGAEYMRRIAAMNDLHHLVSLR